MPRIAPMTVETPAVPAPAEAQSLVAVANDPVVQRVAAKLNAAPVPAFISSQRLFRERLFARLPQLATRIVQFLEADVEEVTLPNGMIQQKVPADMALTDGQLKLISMLVNKALPQMTPTNQNGDDADKARGEGKQQIKISINQVGPNVDFAQLPGKVDGVVQGAARQVAKITVRRLDEQTPEPIDITPTQTD